MGNVSITIQATCLLSSMRLCPLLARGFEPRRATGELSRNELRDRLSMKYEVAEYVIDTARYRISTAGAAIPVEPKVFDLLVYLIRHRDRVLSREELFREVWEGREVSDATLSNHVKSARKILGDSGELQKTIQTIRGRGYQFIAPVREIADDVASPEADKAPAPPPQRVTSANRCAGLAPASGAGRPGALRRRAVRVVLPRSLSTRRRAPNRPTFSWRPSMCPVVMRPRRGGPLRTRSRGKSSAICGRSPG